MLKLDNPMCDFDKLEVVELITVRSYLRLLTLFLGAGATFDLTFFDNSKVIDFDD